MIICSTDKKMPLRIIAYDGANYRSQLLNKYAKRFYACISVVLYFGKERWNASKNLKDLLDVLKHVDEVISQCVNLFKEPFEMMFKKELLRNSQISVQLFNHILLIRIPNSFSARS